MAFFIIVKTLDLHFIQLPQFYALESLSDEKDISRIKIAFNSKSKEFGVINYDNAVWNESYHYINNRNDDFPEENFVIDAYKSLGLNGVHLFDKKSKRVWSRSWDRTNWSEMNFPAFDQPSLFVKEQLLISNDEVANNNNLPLTKAGFVLIENKFIIFAATSIFQANLDGSANGTMLFWRIVDQQVLSDLQERAGIIFRIEIIESKKNNLLSLSSKNVYKEGSYRTENDEIYGFYPFISGEGGVKFSYQAPSRQFTTDWFNYSSVITLLLFLVALLMISLFFHYVIIRPISKADKRVTAIIKNSDEKIRFSSNRKDELGTLFNLIDRLLDDVASNEQELVSHNLRLQTISRTDGLTNIPNRRAFDLYMVNLFETTTFGEEVSMLICDVDYFKKYNDYYGHALGDNTLRLIANCLRKNLHEDTDFVARYGGEEFVIILKNTNEIQAKSVANNLVRRVKALQIAHKDSKASEVVTISIGYHSFIISGQQQYMSFFELADKALYKAKNEGRNRACN